MNGEEAREILRQLKMYYTGKTGCILNGLPPSITPEMIKEAYRVEGHDGSWYWWPQAGQLASVIGGGSEYLPSGEYIEMAAVRWCTEHQQIVIPAEEFTRIVETEHARREAHARFVRELMGDENSLIQLILNGLVECGYITLETADEYERLVQESPEALLLGTPDDGPGDGQSVVYGLNGGYARRYGSDVRIGEHALGRIGRKPGRGHENLLVNCDRSDISFPPGSKKKIEYGIPTDVGITIKILYIKNNQPS